MIQPTDPVTLGDLLVAAVRVGGFALLSAVAAAVAAFAYRWYARDGIPEGIAVLLGVAVVAVVLNTKSALQSAIVGETDLLDPASAVFTIAAFAAAGVFADGGRRVGDHLGKQTGPVAAIRDLGEMGQIVRSGGRAVTVELPEETEIDDIDGYDPVTDEEKAKLAGATLAFPRGLTVAELRERLVQRLREDYGVGHVDVELTPEGGVEFLAVGSRPAGIGVTLAPGTAAVAVRADPPFAASPGDTVQVWTGGERPQRVATAEFRGASGDVATLALDRADARDLEETTRYRLVTVAGESAAERDFTALLRAADETMGAATVGEGSPLVGVPIGALEFTVVAVRSVSGVEAIPSRSRVLDRGETAYVVARPEEIRRFKAAARTPDGTRTTD